MAENGFSFLLFLVSCILTAFAKDAKTFSNCKAGEGSFHDLTAKTLRGKEIPMKSFKGRILLVVNVATF